MSQNKENQKKRVVQKYNLNEVDDIWGSMLSDEGSDADEELYGLDDFLSGTGSSDRSLGNEQPLDAVDEQLGSDDLLSADGYPQDVLEDSVEIEATDGEFAGAEDLVDEGSSGGGIEEEQAAGETVPAVSEIPEFAAQLEFIGGMRQDVAKARLFAPEKNTILLIDPETNDELIVFFEQLACLRISGLPAGISDRLGESGVQEVIETVDGANHHLLVCARQELDGFLCCLSEKEKTRYPVTLIPKARIRKRTQDRPLTDILLEKRFISRSMLQRALQEFAQLKGMTLENVIAQKARLPLATIEEALDKAKQNQMVGLQTGEILLISGLVNEEQILEALEYHERIQHLELDQFLIDKGIVNEVEVYIALAEKHNIPFLDLRQRKIPREALALLPKSMIVHQEILPLVKKDDVLLVATHAVDMRHLREAILNASACKDVRYVLSPSSQLKKIIHLLNADRR